MSRQWFVGCTRQGQETLAKRELGNQSFETYLPLCITDWSRKPRIRPLLIGYIFIHLDPEADRWRAVFSTYGMRTMLFAGDKPSSIPDWIVDEIREREVGGLVRLEPRVQCKFKKGDVVRMRGSPLQMVFEEPIDNRRAAAFITLLGRADIRTVVPLSRLCASPLLAAAS